MIGQTGRHALKALAVLGKLPPGTYLGAGAIAKEIGAPGNYLGKLLQSLVQEGFVSSQKGIGGGFRLACDPTKTTLYDILEPIEQVSRWNGCLLGRKACDARNPCDLHHRWIKVRATYLGFLKGAKLSDLGD